MSAKCPVLLQKRRFAAKRGIFEDAGGRGCARKSGALQFCLVIACQTADSPYHKQLLFSLHRIRAARIESNVRSKRSSSSWQSKFAWPVTAQEAPVLPHRRCRFPLPRDGKFIEEVGRYNPCTEPAWCSSTWRRSTSGSRTAPSDRYGCQLLKRARENA
mgnify:CR=1 FL=1